MEILTSRGIVLSHRSTGESDIICAVITEKSGIMHLQFKGLRKSKRRSHNAAEPGSLITFTCISHPGRGIVTPSEFSAIDDNSVIRNDFEKLLVLLFLLEITEKITPPGMETGHVFRLLSAARITLMTTTYPVHLAMFFVLHSMRLNGILPDYTRCRKCGRTDFNRFVPDQADFNPVCDRCSRTAEQLLNDDALSLIRASMSTRFSSLDLESFERNIPMEILKYLVRFIQGHYEVKLHSIGFIA